jgi:hypothetical protein
MSTYNGHSALLFKLEGNLIRMYYLTIPFTNFSSVKNFSVAVELFVTLLTKLWKAGFRTLTKQ